MGMGGRRAPRASRNNKLAFQTEGLFDMLRCTSLPCGTLLRASTTTPKNVLVCPRRRRSTAQLVDELATRERTPVSVRQLIAFGAREENAIHSCVFLREELPVRFAHMLKE